MKRYRLSEKEESLLSEYKEEMIKAEFSTVTIDVEIQQIRKWVDFLGLDAEPDYNVIEEKYFAKVKRFYDWVFHGVKPNKRRKSVHELRKKRFAEMEQLLNEYDERHKKQYRNSRDGHIAYCDSHSVMFGRGEETGRFWR